MFKSSTSVVLFSLVFSIALDIASVAHASPESTIVRIADLDRRTELGAYELLRRIERAAEEVCGEDFARRYIAARRVYRQCRDSTILATVDRLGDEQLNAAYVTRYGAL